LANNMEYFYTLQKCIYENESKVDEMTKLLKEKFPKIKFPMMTGKTLKFQTKIATI
jgi:hypothetical protein